MREKELPEEYGITEAAGYVLVTNRTTAGGADVASRGRSQVDSTPIRANGRGSQQVKYDGG
jgi:hypothetical protein